MRARCCRPWRGSPPSRSSWLANLAALLVLIGAGIAGIWAQAGAVATYAAVSYAGCRGWAFAASEGAKRGMA